MVVGGTGRLGVNAPRPVVLASTSELGSVIILPLHKGENRVQEYQRIWTHAMRSNVQVFYPIAPEMVNIVYF